MLRANAKVILLCLIVTLLNSGCTKYVPQPYEVTLSVPPNLTRPLEAMPVLPKAREDGTRDLCEMHKYRVRHQYILCAEYQRMDKLISGITENRQRFNVPANCNSIIDGVKKRLHTVCEK